MHWYLIHTKPKQEKSALQNLENQGYVCYLPLIFVEKLIGGARVVAGEALFPRYLFVQLGQDHAAKTWAPIRSTRGVSRLVCFGSEPAKLDQRLVERIRHCEQLQRSAPEPLFVSGERVCVASGPFEGIEGVFQMLDGDRRVLVLIDMLSQPVSLSLEARLIHSINQRPITR